MSLEVLTLADGASGTSADIVPALGFNCYRFTARDDNGPVEVLWSAPGFADGDMKPSGSGIPLHVSLCRPNSPSARYRFNGKHYTLDRRRRPGQCHSRLRDQSPVARCRGSDAHRVRATVSGFARRPDDTGALAGRLSHHGRVSPDGQHAGQSSSRLRIPNQSLCRLGLARTATFACRWAAERARLSSCTCRWSQLGPGRPVADWAQTTPPHRPASWRAECRSAEMQLDNVFGGLTFDNHRCTADGSRSRERPDDDHDVRRPVHRLRGLQPAAPRGGLHRALHQPARRVRIGSAGGTSQFASAPAGRSVSHANRVSGGLRIESNVLHVVRAYQNPLSPENRSMRLTARSWLLLACGGLLLTSAARLSAAPAAEPRRPNVLLIMTDDQGWGDFGFHGNPT